MSNVLTVQARSAILSRIRSRLILTGSIVFSASAIVAILALMPAYLSVVIPKMSFPDSQVSPEQLAQEEADRTEAANVRLLLGTLAPFAQERVAVHTIITTLNGVRPDDIEIQRIAYSSGKTAGEIVITGVATDRDNVSAYREALVQTKMFENVSVPVAALVGASEGNFTMTLTGKF